MEGPKERKKERKKTMINAGQWLWLKLIQKTTPKYKVVNVVYGVALFTFKQCPLVAN